MAGRIILLMILILVSGFFTMARTALFTLGRSKVQQLATVPGRANQLILKMKQEPQTLLTTLSAANHLVNISAASLATVMVMQAFPEYMGYAVGLAIGVMTVLILVFGEIFPKTVATRHNVGIARTVIIPLYGLSWVLYPVVCFLKLIHRLMRTGEGSSAVSEADLITFADVVQEEGEIKPDERELIYNVIKLDDVNVSEIMTPSADIFAIDRSKPLDIKAVIDSGYSRIPVIDGNIDHVVGIVNIKDLCRQKVTPGQGIDIEKIMREPYFVPEYKKLDQLLNRFKEKKDHAAIVVNEYGEVSGIVTLEDVLEAIVGDILDETDIVNPPVVKIRDREWLVLGSADIEAVNERLDMAIPASSEYETFSGYILERIGRIPKPLEQIVIDNYDITVKEMEGNRIKSFIIRRN
jgi:putative hemolysin